LRIYREQLGRSLVRKAAEDQAMIEEYQRLVVAEEAREAAKAKAAREERIQKDE
jgi:hypothetical protein